MKRPAPDAIAGVGGRGPAGRARQGSSSMSATRRHKTPDTLFQLGISLLLVTLCWALWPGTTAAQTPPTRRLTVNQVISSTWPAVTVNFNLRSLDNTALGE